MLKPLGTVKESYNLSQYNLTQNGTYRFETHVNIQGGDATAYTVWVDFIIDNGRISPLVPATGAYTIVDTVLPDTKDNVRVVYPTLKSDTQDHTYLNGFLKNNVEEALYYLQKDYPRGSEITLDYTVTYNDGTLISVLFEGTVTPPDSEAVKVAFTACLAPGNGYTLKPESLAQEAVNLIFQDKIILIRSWRNPEIVIEREHIIPGDFRP